MGTDADKAGAEWFANVALGAPGSNNPAQNFRDAAETVQSPYLAEALADRAARIDAGLDNGQAKDPGSPEDIYWGSNLG